MGEEEQLPPRQAAPKLVEECLEVDPAWAAKAEQQPQVAAREGARRGLKGSDDVGQVQILASDPVDRALSQIDVQSHRSPEVLQNRVHVHHLSTHRVEEDSRVVSVEGTA
jgi:hypothetical protein